MCESVGAEPIDSEIPPDFYDFAYQTQQAMQIYNYLPDKWITGTATTYAGKDYTIIETLYKWMGVEDGDRLLIFDLLVFIDKENGKSINNKLKPKPIKKK